MNKAKKTIGWCNYTWNPVTGCLHSCRYTYCYNTLKPGSVLTRGLASYLDNNGEKIRLGGGGRWRSRETGRNHIAKKGEMNPFGFDPTFYPHRLNEPSKEKKPSKIFVVDTGDLFGKWVFKEWIDEVFKIAIKCPHHTFQFLTKNPRRMQEFTFPDNAWAGTSVNTDEDKDRAEILKTVKAPVRFLSIEPLLGPVTFSLKGLQWIIVGAQSGDNPVIPEKDWVDALLGQAKELNIPVFVKKNLRPYYPCNREEYPSPTVNPTPIPLSLPKPNKSIDVKPYRTPTFKESVTEKVVNHHAEVEAKESIKEKNMIIKNEGKGIKEVNISIKNGEINIRLGYESESKPTETKPEVMPIKISKSTKEQAYELLEQGLSPQEVSQRLNIPRGAANAYKAWITMRKQKDLITT